MVASEDGPKGQHYSQNMELSRNHHHHGVPVLINVRIPEAIGNTLFEDSGVIWIGYVGIDPDPKSLRSKSMC